MSINSFPPFIKLFLLFSAQSSKHYVTIPDSTTELYATIPDSAIDLYVTISGSATDLYATIPGSTTDLHVNNSGLCGCPALLSFPARRVKPPHPPQPEVASGCEPLCLPEETSALERLIREGSPERIF